MVVVIIHMIDLSFFLAILSLYTQHLILIDGRDELWSIPEQDELHFPNLKRLFNRPQF